MRGRFIVICGIDGSGKSTQEQLLADSLTQGGRRPLQTRSPTDWYRQNPTVRKFLLEGTSPISQESLALLSATDRLIQNETEIIPALDSGQDVICNRYVYSALAYFQVRGGDVSFVKGINSRAITPDFGILITAPPEICIDRIISRDGEKRKFEERSAEYLGRVQNALVEHWPHNFLCVDGEQSVDSLAAEILSYIDTR